MKKLTLALVLLSFLGFNANADMNVGVKLTAADLSADGSETQNSGATVVQKERDASFELASIFAEAMVSLGAMDMAVGVEMVPLTAEVAVIGGGTGFDATVEVGNLRSAYIQPMMTTDGGVSLYLKAGYAQADLDISNVSRQATASATGDSASTDTNLDQELEGPMYGLGMQISTDSIIDAIRIEATRHDFDEISFTNSNNKKLKADATMDAISIALVKSF
tara:strand:+ start:373 stop:1035 length:663 start_codon:yes stop_codon:yes gene_type:complete